MKLPPRPPKKEPPNTAYDCWLIAEDEGGSQEDRRLRYHQLMVQYGFLIPKDANGDGPRFACGWDPDPSRRTSDAI